MYILTTDHISHRYKNRTQQWPPSQYIIIVDLMNMGARSMVVLADGHHVVRIPVDTLFGRAYLHQRQREPAARREERGMGVLEETFPIKHTKNGTRKNTEGG